jgi:hypothetical protein
MIASAHQRGDFVLGIAGLGENSDRVLAGSGNSLVTSQLRGKTYVDLTSDSRKRLSFHSFRII